MNVKSYFISMVFALPAFVLGNTVARTDALFAGFAQILSLILLVLIAIWTVRRLRNAGKSGWWSLALIPPTTILLLGYNFFAPSSKEHVDTGLYVYGIQEKGFWRRSIVLIISIFLLYLSAMYLIFLAEWLYA